MSIYEKYELRRVVNGCGKMTVLGATAVHPEIAGAIGQASMEYFVMEELMKKAGKEIAKATGAEDGCPAIGAAAGIAISVAAVITGTNRSLIERLPDSEGLKNEIIVQKGHAVNFGASVTQMICIGGGRVVEVGQANHVEENHIKEAVNEKTAALLYIKSHHSVQKGMQSIETMLSIAREKNIPLIIDAAAEESLTKYISLGADLVIYSGGKAIGGPTSGFICGKSKLIDACHMQYKGIGRAMKVGKEAIVGLLAAIERYGLSKDDSKSQIERMAWLVNQFKDIPGIKASVVQDEAGREIYRAQLTIDEQIAGISASEIVKKLEEGNPAVFLRKYYLNSGIISIDPRPLLDKQEELIAEQIKRILNRELT